MNRNVLNYELRQPLTFYDSEFTVYLSYNRVLNTILVLGNEIFLEADRVFKAFENLLDTKNDKKNAKELYRMTPTGQRLLLNELIKEFIEIKKADGTDMGGVYFDIVQDINLVYESFFEVYHIDLQQEKEKLTWLKFNVLLAELPAGCSLMRAIHSRTMKTPRRSDYKDSNDYYAAKRFIAKYRLEQTEYDPEKVKEIHEIVAKQKFKAWY